MASKVEGERRGISWKTREGRTEGRTEGMVEEKVEEGTVGRTEGRLVFEWD